MSGVIKRAEGAPAIEPLPSVRRVVAAPLPDPQITALEERVRQLEQQLEEERTEAKRAIATAHAAIVARGAKPMSQPRLIAKMPDHELWMAAVSDPEGNAVELMEERR